VPQSKRGITSAEVKGCLSPRTRLPFTDDDWEKLASDLESHRQIIASNTANAELSPLLRADIQCAEISSALRPQIEPLQEAIKLASGRVDPKQAISLLVAIEDFIQFYPPRAEGHPKKIDRVYEDFWRKGLRKQLRMRLYQNCTRKPGTPLEASRAAHRMAFGPKCDAIISFILGRVYGIEVDVEAIRKGRIRRSKDGT
jgi:hypothetical protein